MHELAIAESIVRTVAQEKLRRKLDKILAVGIRIGELTDIMPEALEFGFQSLTANTDLAGCNLIIERIAVAGFCRTCQQPLKISDLIFSCPHCYSTDLDIQTGQEIRT
jgi:hydrogenase nickel incorporation protein HypA/HybF